MSYPSTEIDKLTFELNGLAQAYAKKASELASDPYFKEAIIKVSVSGFVWSLYHAFSDQFGRDALNHELKVQSAQIDHISSQPTKKEH